MSYYPTLAEDLTRAKEILDRGRADLEAMPEDARAALVAAQWAPGGTIYGADIYAAYKLLESFVGALTATVFTEADLRVLDPPPAMVYRCRWQLRGVHVHCRMFQALTPQHTWQKNGDLVFDEKGWPPFRDNLLACGIEVVEDGS